MVGHHYSGEEGEEYFRYQRQLAPIGARLNTAKFSKYVKPGDTVIDFGCGGGWTLELLPAQRKIGIEPNPAARAVARDHLDVVAGSPKELADATADVVISNHALEHALRPYDELVELRRILKPGGQLVICLPFDDWRHEARPEVDPNHHLYTWSPLLLHNLLVEAGFAVRELRVLTDAWPPVLAISSRLPSPAFRLLSWFWAVFRHRRQVMAVAISKPTPS